MGTVAEMIKKIRQLEAGEDSEPSTATEDPPPRRKPGVGKASKKKNQITTCVVCWPEEENKLSLISAKKIISPSQDDFAPDSFCKVKGFESHLCRMVAVGTEAEMKKRIRELEAGDDAEEASSPPKKKPRVEKAPKGRKLLGKENRKRTPSQAKKEGKKGSIILVAATQAGNNTSATPTKSTALSTLLQEITNTTTAAPSAPCQENTNTTSAAPFQENTNTTSASTLQENTNTTSTTPSAPLQENTNTTLAAPFAPLLENTSTAAPTAPLQENTDTSVTPAAPSEVLFDDPYDQYFSDEEEMGSVYENHNAEDDQGESNDH